MTKKPEKPVYRFVIYGRGKSGKTCYLTSLAMDRRVHPKGYTCEWLSSATHCPRPTELDEHLWERDRPDVARYLGKQWLSQAIEALQAGELPSANPNEAAPYRYWFEFGQTLQLEDGNAHERVYTVEMLDYSGELIDPDISEEELAVLVRRHMQEADAILILAEAPLEGADWNSQYPEFRKLRAAFQLIRKSDTPVALVINKWDRLKENYTLDGFLQLSDGDKEPQDDGPAHVQLYTTLRVSVGKENFKAFAVSALGPCSLKSFVDPISGRSFVKEVPLSTTPLKSEGVEDPFLWLLERHNRALLDRVQRAVAALNPLKFWQLVNGATTLSASEIEKAERFLTDVPQWSRATDNAKQSRLKSTTMQAASACLLIISTVLLIFQSVFAIQDSSRLKEIAVLTQTELTTPASLDSNSITSLADRVKRIEEADLWITGYTQSSLLRAGSKMLQWFRRSDTAGLATQVRGQYHKSKLYLDKLDQLNRLDQAACAAKSLTAIDAIEASVKDWLIGAPMELAYHADQVKISCQTARAAGRKGALDSQLGELKKLSEEVLKALDETAIIAVESQLDAMKSNLQVSVDTPELLAGVQEVERSIRLAKNQVAAADRKEFSEREVLKIRNLVEAVQLSKTPEELARLTQASKQLSEVQKSEKATTEMLQEWKLFEKAANEATGRIEDDRIATDLTARFEQAVLKRDLVSMAQCITTSKGTKPGTETTKALSSLTQRFRDSYIDMLSGLVNKEARQLNWSKAEEHFSAVTSSAEVRLVLGDEIEVLKSYKEKWIHLPEDQYLYSRIVSEPDTEARYLEYLDKSRLQRMKAVVQTRLEAMKFRKTKNSYRLLIDHIIVKAAQTGAVDYADYKLRLYASLNGTPVIETDDVTITYDSELRFTQNAQDIGPFTADEQIQVTFKPWSDDASLYKDLGGSTHTLKLEDLESAKEILIAPKDVGYPNVYVYLRVNGLPELPSLPNYGD